MRPFSLFGLACMMLFISVLASAPVQAQTAPRVVLFEDPTLSADRLHYPLLLSEGRGYRILCASQAEEEAVIRGLGFTTVPSTIVSALDPEVVAAHPEANPRLCPTGPDYAIRIYSAEGDQGPVHYLQFPTDFGSDELSGRLYVPGCIGLVEALGLDLENALNADPTPFFTGKIHPLSCLSGEPIPEDPTSFADWCVKTDRSAAETATVMAVLDTTPGGISALNNPAACASANSFLRAVPFMNLTGKGVQSLAPLAHQTHLTSLTLAGNDITSVEPLKSLTALGFLDLSGNKISSITALSPLSVLTRLSLSDNEITDIRALSALALLTNLELDGNQIGSLEPLQFLQALSHLSLAGNGLTGDLLEPLTALGALTTLDLSDNQIETFAFLGAMPSTLAIDLTGNPIAQSGQSFLDICIVNLNAATPFGETVRKLVSSFGAGTCLAASNAIMANTTLDLSGKILSDIGPLASLTHLTSLNLSANAITDISALSGLVNLTDLDLTDNSIGDIRPVGPLLSLTSFAAAGNPVLLDDFLSACLMRGHPDLLTHDQTIEVDALLEASGQDKCLPATNELSRLSFGDFRNKGLTTLKYFGVLEDITAIELSGNGLNDLVGLQGLGALKRIVARENNIASLASIRPMRGLETLVLDGNPVTSLLGVSDLTRLRRLSISNTAVRSVLPLADLPFLETAELRNLLLSYEFFREYCIVNRFDPIALGPVRSFMAALEGPLVAANVDLADCTAMEDWVAAQTVLSLNKKTILAVNPIRFFTNLEELTLYDNQISDIRPIAALRLLTKLNLATNQIASLPQLQSSGLREVYLSNNQIPDISALAPLSALVRIEVRDNQLASVAPLLANAAASVFDLRNNRIAVTQFAEVPVLLRSYLGGNPVCTSPPFFLPQFPFADTQAACDRTPPLIIFPFDHISITNGSVSELLLQDCATCPIINIRPRLLPTPINP